MGNYKKQFWWHRNDARARGIPFLLTYGEWLQIWIDSGHLHERGHCKGQYCMARFGDVGPYASWNVKIITCSENISEGLRGKPKSEETCRRMSEARRGYIRSPQHLAKLIKQCKTNAAARRALSEERAAQVRRLYVPRTKTMHALAAEFEVSLMAIRTALGRR